MGIRFTFTNFRIGTRSAKVVVVILWAITIAIGVILTVMPSVDPEFYDVSEVCTGLSLSRNNVFEQRTIKDKNCGCFRVLKFLSILLIMFMLAPNLVCTLG